MFSRKWIKYGLIVFSLFFFITYVMDLDAYARAGGGQSSGSRGSRSYSAPSPNRCMPFHALHKVILGGIAET